MLLLGRRAEVLLPVLRLRFRLEEDRGRLFFASLELLDLFWLDPPWFPFCLAG